MRCVEPVITAATPASPSAKDNPLAPRMLALAQERHERRLTALLAQELADSLAEWAAREFPPLRLVAAREVSS